MAYNGYDSFGQWQRAQAGMDALNNQGIVMPGKPAMPTAPAPAFNQGASVAAPFTPEQTPPMLPPQAGLPMQGDAQMPATKGSGKGPSQMQTPMQAQVPQAGPDNLNGSNTMPQGSNRPMDLQALISGLMQSGLLGGL